MCEKCGFSIFECKIDGKSICFLRTRDSGRFFSRPPSSQLTNVYCVKSDGSYVTSR